MRLTLTSDELIEITKKKRFGAQARALYKQGIKHEKRGDGFPLVSRDYWLKRMSAESSDTTKKVKLNKL